MRDIDAKYPQYGFKDHKGYGTKSHCQAIEKYGPCEHHRMTLAPIKYMDLSSTSNACLLRNANFATGFIIHTC